MSRLLQILYDKSYKMLPEGTAGDVDECRESGQTSQACKSRQSRSSFQMTCYSYELNKRLRRQDTL